MNLNDFDDILKQKLKDMPVEHSTPDWDRMNRELDEDSVKDQIFDEQVNRKLQQLNVHNFARPNWNGLYELIDKRIQNKRRVIVNKSFEAIAVLLLFFTAFNLGYYNTSEDGPTNIQEEQVPTFYASADADQPSDSESIINTTPPTEKSNNTEIKPTFNTSNQAVVNNVRSIESTAGLARLNTRQLITDNGTINQTNLPLLALHSTESTPQDIFNNNGQFTVNHSKEVPEDVMAQAFPKDFSTLELDHINLNTLDESMALQNLTILDSKASNPSNWFVSASMAFNNNIVESAFYKLVEDQARNTLFNEQIFNKEIKSAYNTSAALHFGYKLGQMEIASGAEFQRLKYSPLVILTTGDLVSYTNTNIESIQYDFLSIPLELNTAVYNKKSWKARIHAGAIASFLLDAKETVTQQIKRGARTIDVPEDQVDLHLLGFAFPDGALSDEAQHGETKKLSDFVRYKANIGLSLSKRITNRTEIFGRTDFQYQLPKANLINSNVDLINTLSFSVGVKQFLG